MKKALVILFVNIPICLFAQQSIQFIGEKIDFAINKERYSINGIYYFSNPTSSEIKQTILFPFSEDADSLILKRIYNLTYSESIDYQLLNNAVSFKIILPPKDTIQINISYSQNTEKENVYILESTQTWGQPLIHADYSLTFDKSVKIDSLSMKADSLINHVFYWTKQNFFPEDNFIVWIKQ